MSIEVIGALVSIGVVVLGVASTWGALRTRITSLEKSRVEQGKRLGALERVAAFEEGRNGRRRPSVAFAAQPDDDDESGPEGDR